MKERNWKYLRKSWTFLIYNESKLTHSGVNISFTLCDNTRDQVKKHNQNHNKNTRNKTYMEICTHAYMCICEPRL